MNIKYELNNVHICQNNICFKINSFLVKNMTDKVILDMPFISSLYPFLIEHNSTTFEPFRQKVKFEFASKFDIDTDKGLNVLIYAKTKHLNFLKQEIKYKKLLNNYLINCYSKKLTVLIKKTS